MSACDNFVKYHFGAFLRLAESWKGGGCLAGEGGSNPAGRTAVFLSISSEFYILMTCEFYVPH